MGLTAKRPSANKEVEKFSDTVKAEKKDAPKMRLNAQIDADLYRTFHAIAIGRGESITDLVNTFVVDYIRQNAAGMGKQK